MKLNSFHCASFNPFPIVPVGLNLNAGRNSPFLLRNPQQMLDFLEMLFWYQKCSYLLQAQHTNAASIQIFLVVERMNVF